MKVYGLDDIIGSHEGFFCCLRGLHGNAYCRDFMEGDRGTRNGKAERFTDLGY